MSDTKKAKLKSSWFGIIVITIVFAVFGFFWGLIPDNWSSWWGFLPLKYTIVAAILGLYFCFFWIIIYEKLPETKSFVEENLQEIREEIQSVGFWKHIYREGHPTARRMLVKSFAEKSIEHILHGSERISQEEYVRLLSAFSEESTKQIFATSLLTPTKWLDGVLKSDYRNYLNLQKKLKKKYHEIEIVRIFINKKSDFFDSPFCKELIRLHEESKIKIGFFDQEEVIRHRGQDYCRDFILFEDRYGKWILDAGTLKESEVENEGGGTVHLIDSPLVDSRYSDIVKFLKGAGVKMGKDLKQAK